MDDQTASSTSVLTGETLPLSVHVTTCGETPYATIMKAWIDFNRDSVFDSATELVLEWQGSTLNETVAQDVTVPAVPSADFVSGPTRMRVVLFETDSADFDACVDASFQFGSVVDFTVDIAEVASVPEDCAPGSVLSTAQTPLMCVEAAPLRAPCSA